MEGVLGYDFLLTFCSNYVSYRFWDIQRPKIWRHWHPSLGQSRSLKEVPFDSLVMVSCLLVFYSNFVPKSTVLRYSTWNPGHSRSSERTRVDPPPMTSYHINVLWQLYFMGLSRTAYEINGDFSRKSQIFPTPCILRPSLRLPLVIGYRRLGSKTRIMALPGRKTCLMISSAIWIQYANVADRRTDTSQQQRPR